MRIQHIIGLAGLLWVGYGCTKEGPPGPQGPQGPPGENGTGGGGGSLQVMTFTLPATEDYRWSGGLFEGTYYYTLVRAADENYRVALTLPESLTDYIENGTLLVYMKDGQRWQQWPYSPIDFSGIRNYGYRLFLGYDGYHIDFYATGPQSVDAFRTEIRLVVVPKTVDGALEP